MCEGRVPETTDLPENGSEICIQINKSRDSPRTEARVVQALQQPGIFKQHGALRKDSDLRFQIPRVLSITAQALQSFVSFSALCQANFARLPPDCSLHRRAALGNKAAFAGCPHPAFFPRVSAKGAQAVGGAEPERTARPPKPGWKPARVKDGQRENCKRKKNQPGEWKRCV